MLSVVVLAGARPLHVVHAWARASVGAPGDPAIEYVARPEWYFLPIFKLQRRFRGGSSSSRRACCRASGRWACSQGCPSSAAQAPTHRKGAPAAGRRSARGPRRHGDSRRHDGVRGCDRREGAEGQRESREDRARGASARDDRRSRRRAHSSSTRTTRWSGARTCSIRECAACHEDCSNKPFKGVMCLQEYGSREWVKTVLERPTRSARSSATRRSTRWISFTGDEPTTNALAEIRLRSEQRAPTYERRARRVRGAAAFENEGCESCHTLDRRRHRRRAGPEGAGRPKTGYTRSFAAPLRPSGSAAKTDKDGLVSTRETGQR